MTLALGFMVVLLVIAAGVHGLVLAQLHGSGMLRQRIAAQQLAEGGIARTLAWFNSTNYQVPDPKTLSATVPVRLKTGTVPVTLPANHPDGYTDALGQVRSGVVGNFQKYLTNQSGSVGTYTVSATLMAAQPETWEAIATAQVGTASQQAGAILVRDQQALFADALFGRDNLVLNGRASTDSYDSSLGAYGGANVFQTGSVRSNGDINLTGGAVVNGDAIPGPDHVVSTNGNATVTGVSTAASSEKSLPVPVVPANAVNLGAINLSGKATQTLTAGTYLVSSLSITGNGQLIIDASKGPVNVYVSGAVSVAGNGITNSSGLPSNFNLVETGTAAVSLAGNGTFSGTVYAPTSAVTLSGNGTTFGAVLGASLNLVGNGVIHFDQALRTSTTVPGPLRLVAQWVPPT